jgi:hypothetical protein
MPCCVVLGCRTGYRVTKKYPIPIIHKCFKVPKDFEIKAKWSDATGGASCTTNSLNLCALFFISRVFRDEDRIIEGETIVQR